MADSLRDNTSIDSIINKCDICESVVNLKLCARCRAVAYCSKNHQKQAWPEHKALCKRSMQQTIAKTNDSEKSTNAGDLGDQFTSLSIESRVSSSAVTSTEKRVMHQCDELRKDEFYDLFTNDCDPSLGPCHADGASAINNKVISLPCNNEQQKTHINTEKVSDLSKEEEVNESGSSEKFILESEESVLHAPDYTEQAEVQTSNKVSDKTMPYLSVIEGRNKTLGDYVIKCLNSYGICVLDNFLGDSKGTDILDDVMIMHEHGELTRGQLVNMNSPGNEVRGDIITWVDGSEQGCNNVNFLISSIDAIMLHCQKSLGHYHIKGRSKAMVAAYPGKSTCFLRHVDNPSGDGRCVTCIYYLNKDWNSKTDGGLLRIFPQGSNQVANVEPKFDRLLFFWSDRRNPHEVLPAYRTRYAITVWYYDEQERRRAVKKFRRGGTIDTKEKGMIPLCNGMKTGP